MDKRLKELRSLSRRVHQGRGIPLLVPSAMVQTSIVILDITLSLRDDEFWNLRASCGGTSQIKVRTGRYIIVRKEGVAAVAWVGHGSDVGHAWGAFQCDFGGGCLHEIAGAIGGTWSDLIHDGWLQSKSCLIRCFFDFMRERERERAANLNADCRQ